MYQNIYTVVTFRSTTHLHEESSMTLAYAAIGLAWTLWVIANVVLAATKPKHEKRYAVGIAIGLIGLLALFLWAIASGTRPG